jgi:lipoyl synthase
LPNPKALPPTIRVSLGTAIVLGLLEGKLDADPSTAYLMTYTQGKCTANCGFCPQARTSKSSTELLSRVSWPAFPTLGVIDAIGEAARQGKIRRACIQALNYPGVFNNLEAFAKEIKKGSALPVSVSCQPTTKVEMEQLAAAGVDRLGIALDAASETVFNRVKGLDVGGGYFWHDLLRRLEEALVVFGKGNVSTHLIIGLGETEKEAAEFLQRCVDLGVVPALFAFTAVRGTALETTPPPKIESYRRMQLSRYLIVNGMTRAEKMQFNDESEITNYGLTQEALNKIVESGLPFQTSGCPDCNRPYYNEKPSGPIYNYPRELTEQEIEKIKNQLGY